MDPERTPVVVAAGQASSRDRSLGAIDLATAAAEQVLSTAARLRSAIERLTVVNILSRAAGLAPASTVATRLGLTGITCETTTVSGSTPQWLVQRAAADIAAGRISATLITGAEAVRSGRLHSPRADPAPVPGEDQPPAAEQLPPDTVIGTDRLGCSEAEIDAGLFVPVYVYPVIENALALRDGRRPEQQRAFIGAFMSRLAAVAAKNPNAWFQTARTPAEIATPSPGNRLVAEPYTKLMTAFLGGSQGAALAVTSLAVARSLGVDDGAMFVRSSAMADDVWFPSARPDLATSPAIRAAGRAALDAGAVGLDEIDFVDLYSCFPSAVQLGAEALGLALDDRRGLTLTGGLPYFGGPGNNYTTHAIATALELLREHGGHALVTALGWYITKHAIGVYSATPPPGGFRAVDMSDAQAEIDATAVDVVPRGEQVERQRARVIAGTVIYGSEGEVTSAPVFAELEGGRRVVASAEPEELAALAGTSPAGLSILLAGSPPRYRVE